MPGKRFGERPFPQADRAFCIVPHRREASVGKFRGASRSWGMQRPVSGKKAWAKASSEPGSGSEPWECLGPLFLADDPRARRRGRVAEEEKGGDGIPAAEEFPARPFAQPTAPSLRILPTRPPTTAPK